MFLSLPIISHLAPLTLVIVIGYSRLMRSHEVQVMDLSIAIRASRFLPAILDADLGLIAARRHGAMTALTPNEKRLGHGVGGTGNYEEADCWHICSILGQKIIFERGAFQVLQSRRQYLH